MQCYIPISFSAENNVNLYVEFSNCSRPILAMYNDQQLYMWGTKTVVVKIYMNDVEQ